MGGDTNRDSYRFVIGGLTLWAHFAGGASFQALSPVLPLISEEYGIGHATAGLLVGVVLIIMGAFGLPGGIIAGRLGLRKTYTAAWLLMSLMTLVALSPGFGGLLALRVAFGLGMAAMLPATAPLLMQWFRPKELPIITSLNLAAMSVGMVFSVSASAPMADAIGWQRVLGLFGSIMLAGAFAWIGWGRIREEKRADVPSLAWREIWEVLRNRTVLLLGAADTACFSMYIALSAWLPTFYHEARGMSLTEAGFITSVLPFTGIFAVLLGGFLPLKVSPKRLFFIVPGAMAGLGGLGTFLVDNTGVTYLSVIVFGLGAWLYVPMLLTMPMELPGMTPARMAIVWGWLATAPGIGAFIAPLAVGAMRDSYDSFTPGFLVFAVLAWFLFIAGFLLPKTAPPPKVPESATATGPAPD